MAPQTSTVWKYFENISNDVAKCKLCNNNFSRKGRGTTSLRNHLKSRHPNEFKELKEKEECSEKEKKKSQLPLPSTSNEENKQQTLLTCFEKNKSWDKNDERSKLLDTKIAEMITLDDLPFSHVEDRGFTRLIETASPRYELKKRKFYRDKICEDIYPSVKAKILFDINNITKASKLSFTTDAWSDNTSGVSLLSLTCHAVDDHFQRRHFVLCAEPLTERHTGDYLNRTFDNMLDKWNIAHERVHCVMRDTCANIKSAMSLSELCSLDCFAHQLQLVIKTGVTVQKSVSDLLSNCRAIATHFNHSAVAQDELKKIQIRLNVPQLSVVQDVVTRWNSSLHMLERMNEIKEAVCLYAASNSKVKPLSATEGVLLNNCVAVLKPFDEVTKSISSDSSCVSEIIPLVTTLKVMLKNSRTVQDGIKAMNAKMLSEMTKRFSNIQNNDMYVISTFLDPRYKGKFLEQHALQRAITNLGQLCEEIKDPDSEGEHQKKRRITMETDMTSASSSRSIANTMSVLLSSSDSDNDDHGQPDVGKETASMIDKYHKQKRIQMSEDPLIWWSNNAELYPPLAALARTYLGCPSSSVASERLFSGAGMIYDEKRSRLAPERAQKLLFLKHNLPIIDYKY